MRRSLPFIYLGFNVACALVVLHAAHRVAALMVAEQRTSSDGVDGITFFAMSAPALLFALLINAACAGKALADMWRGRGYRAFAWLRASAAVWVAAILGGRLF